MSVGSPVARCVLVAVGLHGLLLRDVALAQSNGMPARSIAFDIPAQPLDRALDAFGAATGLQIFYENALTSGNRSSPVKGAFEPQAALRMLLGESGLTARLIAPGTISLARPRDADAVLARRQKELFYRPYYGFLQQGVMAALCGRAETRPGTYHITLQYWIDPAGRIARFNLIGSSGSGERDTAVMAAIQQIVLPPPGDMPQPVTMAIEPAQQVACASENAEAPRGP